MPLEIPKLVLNPNKVRLGKKPYKHDSRTLSITEFVSPDIVTPAKFDFDKGRAEFPLTLLGNEKWQSSVIVSEANQLVRLARIEERRTLEISSRVVTNRYKKLSGSRVAGDQLDAGISVLDSMKDWRTGEGWKIGDYTHRIFAFGELDPQDFDLLRRGIFALHGIHLGFWLPKAVLFMESYWDYNGEKGDDWKPGSWGGQLAYAKAYGLTGIEILAWGQKFRVSDNFIDRYCDEAWAVIDSLEYWRVKQIIDVERLSLALEQAAAVK
jgi:hypothetical protein